MKNKDLGFIQLFLYYLGEKTLFLDLCDVYGIEKALELVTLFGGSSIKIPSIKQVKLALRDSDIYYTLKNTTNLLKNIKSLAHKYNLTDMQVKQVFSKVEALFISNKVDEFLDNANLRGSIDESVKYSDIACADISDADIADIETYKDVING